MIRNKFIFLLKRFLVCLVKLFFRVVKLICLRVGNFVFGLIELVINLGFFGVEYLVVVDLVNFVVVLFR